MPPQCLSFRAVLSMALPCALALTAHAAPPNEIDSHMLVFPALAAAVDEINGGSYGLSDNDFVFRAPLDLSDRAGLRVPLLGGTPALPREFIITLSDGEEVASLTRLGRRMTPLESGHFDFRDFDNIESVDLSAIRSIEIKFFTPNRLTDCEAGSLHDESSATEQVPAPGCLAALAAWLACRSRRRR